MRNKLAILLGCALLAAALAACTGPDSGLAPQSSSEPPQSSSVPQPPVEEVRQEYSFTNNTADMTVEIFAEETLVCGPGESVRFYEQAESMRFETPRFSPTQFFDLLNHLTGLAKGNIEIALQGGGDSLYTMDIHSSIEGERELYYVLQPVEHYWFESFKGRKLFLFSLPQLPMEDVLALYPNAVLPDGHKEVEWPDGYCDMLWSTEPLYDVRISSSGFDMDGYGDVDWDEAEGFDLLPGQPYFHTVVHVGDAWLFAVRFADANGDLHYYLHHYNGMGARDVLAYPAFEVGPDEFVPRRGSVEE